MANYFDQFETAPAMAPVPQEPPVIKEASAKPNFFDQFETAEKPKEDISQQGPSPGILEAGAQGFASGLSKFGQTGEALVTGKPEVEKPSPAAAPLAWSDALSPVSKLAPKLAYQLAEGSPVIAGGLAGAAAGSMASPVVGTLLGGAAGAGLTAAAQTLGPALAEELKKTPGDKDGAWARAWEKTASSGAFSALGWGLFPLGSKALEPLKHLAFQAAGVQPAVSVAHQAVTNMQEGKPVTENLGQAYAQGAVGTAIPAIGHKVLKSVFGTKPTTETAPNPEEAKSRLDRWMDGTLGDIVNDAQMKFTPMAARSGSNEARAIARDFADEKRASRWQWNKVDQIIKKAFTEEEQKLMWESADQESVIQQIGTPEFVQQQHDAGIGLSRLTPRQRQGVDAVQAEAKNAWDAAVQEGIVEGAGLPSYTPRMFTKVAGVSEGPPNSLTKIGTNLQTTTQQLKKRKYLLAEDTEDAGRSLLGGESELVRNIRALPLASAKLRDAVAGRRLINKIKEVGTKTGEELVFEGAAPEGVRTFTVDHPAFKVWRPMMREGKAVKDSDGNVKFEKKDLHVRSDFEGPLRAVLTRDQGKIYNAMMDLKARAMSVIMYSPIIHNAVEWGRALPTMPGKVASFKIYFEGNKVLHDVGYMNKAVNNGLVPIGRYGGRQDITSMMEAPDLGTRRSITGELAAAVPDLFSKTAGNAVRRQVANLGDFWHNTLLWDQVGRLQMGLHKNFVDSMLAKGIDEQSAFRAAGHLANRYAGAIPNEAMSQNARKFANLALFSRTFTLGNIGAMKDAFVGLPRDVQAQILRDAGPQALGKVKSYAQKKAIATIILDVGLMYAGNSILQDAIDKLRGDKTLGEIGQGYINRMASLLKKTKEHPFEVLTHPFGALESLSSTSENEPGKQDRILVGYQADGTAIYARNPTGKIGEEVLGWMTTPFDMVKRKLGTVARPIWQLASNDIGFGRKLYDPNPKTSMDVIKNIGNIVYAFMAAQAPAGQLEAAGELARGEGETKTNALKLLGPLAGMTFSKGAPGGPAIGELYKYEERQRYQLAQAMPEIRKQIQRGDTSAAIATMDQIGIAKPLQKYYITTTLNPQSRISKRKTQNFMTGASEEEKERYFRLLNHP